MADHGPDFPFGCTESWGDGGVYFEDMYLHVCNRQSGHTGRHQCKCGSWAADPTPQTDSDT